MKSKLKVIPYCFRTVRVLFAIIALQLPVIGHCDSGNGWFNFFGTKGKDMKEVATKVAELPEQYKINVHGLDFSLDGNNLAVVSSDEYINIWDWRNSRIVRTVEKMQGASDGLTTEPIQFSPDGRLFVACHERAIGNVVVRIWRTDTWEIVHDIVDNVPGIGCYAIRFTPDGKSLIRVAGRGPILFGDTLVVYDTSTWQPVWGIYTVPFYPKALTISPDGKFVAIGGSVINPVGWRSSTPKPTFGNPPLSDQSAIVIVDLVQRTIVRTIQNTVDFDFGQLAWSPDGANLTAMGQRGWDGRANDGHGGYTSGMDTVMVFDAHIGKQIAGDQLVDIAGTALRYTPDGKYLIEGVMNGRGSGLGVRIWDGQHRELLQEIPGEVSSLAVSRDGHYFAMGEVGKTVVWQLK